MISSTRNRAFALVFCLIAACLGSGCSKQEQSGADGRVTIVFWHSFVSSTIPALDELIGRFEKENPGIHIKAQYIPTGDALVQKLITSVQSRTAPDISWLHANYMEGLVKADAIYPMKEFIDGENGLTEEEYADIYPALITYASWRGTLYSIPMEATNLGLLYNKTHFREAGLDPNRPPQTWNELLDYSRRLLVDKNKDGRFERVGFLVPAVPATGPQGPYMVWQWIPFLWQAGGDMIDEQQTRVTFGDQPGVQALTFWKQIYDLQNQRNFTNEYQSAFISQQASMMLDGPWNLPNYPRMLKNIEWGIGPLPGGPEKQATVVAGEYLAIFKQSKHPKEAWAFLRWMLKPEVQAFWSMKSGYLPVRKSVLDVPEYQAYLKENPGLKAFVDQMQYAQAQRPIDHFPVEIERNLAVAIEKATVGGGDPKAALEEAVSASNQLLQSAAATAQK